MWPNSQEIADLVTFTEEIFKGKHHFFVQWSSIITYPRVSQKIAESHRIKYKKTVDVSTSQSIKHS